MKDLHTKHNKLLSVYDELDTVHYELL